MPWVVGRGHGPWLWVWVWVNVVGRKKKIPKNINLKNQMAKSCKIHGTKIFAYIPGVLFPFPAVSKANKRIL